jgi:hypothetical protein
MNKHLQEMKNLKDGDKIVVFNPDWRDTMTATVTHIEVLDEGTEDEDIQVYFIDEGLYKGEDGKLYDIESNEEAGDYMGWCTACDYIGKCA